MRPFRSNQVQRSRDDNDGTANSLMLSFGGDQYGAILINLFGDDNFQGSIERVISKNETVNPAAAWVGATSTALNATTFGDRSREDRESFDVTQGLGR